MGKGFVFTVWFSVSFTAMWTTMVLLSPPSGMASALVPATISHTADQAAFLPREMKDNRLNTTQVEGKGKSDGRAAILRSSCFSANRASSCAEIASSERQVPTGSDPLHHNRSPFGRFLP
ncbi:unnamed protein product [Victoria cruziana]